MGLRGGPGGGGECARSEGPPPVRGGSGGVRCRTPPENLVILTPAETICDVKFAQK